MVDTKFKVGFLMYFGGYATLIYAPSPMDLLGIIIKTIGLILIASSVLGEDNKNKTTNHVCF